MLYASDNLKVRKREMSFGSLLGVVIGEGKYRRANGTFLPTPFGIHGSLQGFYPNLTIGYSESGRLRIKREQSDEMYLIMSFMNKKGAGKDGGRISVPFLQKPDVVVYGKTFRLANGAYVLDSIVMRLNDGDVVRVMKNEGLCRTRSKLYVRHGNVVRETDLENVKTVYRKFGCEVPFSLIRSESGRIMLDDSEWRWL